MLPLDDRACHETLTTTLDDLLDTSPRESTRLRDLLLRRTPGLGRPDRRSHNTIRFYGTVRRRFGGEQEGSDAVVQLRGPESDHSCSSDLTLPLVERDGDRIRVDFASVDRIRVSRSLCKGMQARYHNFTIKDG